MSASPPPPNPLADWRPSGVHLLDESDLRALVGAFYLRHEGLRSSGLTSEVYAGLMFPNDRKAWRDRAADEMFSCALRFLAAARALGVKHDVLAKPYETRVGHAMGDVETIARSFGALVLGADVAAYEPKAGDAMITGVGNALHCSCIVEVVDGYELHCCDGGQGHVGDMAIEPNLYELERGRAGAVVRSIESPRYSPAKPGPPRPVRSFVNLWALLLNAGVLADRLPGPREHGPEPDQGARDRPHPPLRLAGHAVVRRPPRARP